MLGPCKGNTRRGEEDSSSFLPSYVLDISSFVPPPPQNCYSVYDWLRWGTYSLEFMRVSKQGMNLPETGQGLGFVRVTLVLL